MQKKREISGALLAAVVDEYELRATLCSAEPYGSGHINDTFAVLMDQAGTPIRYILQRINRNVFRKPPEVMENITRVTAHVAAQLRGHPDASRRVLTVVPSRRGAPYVQDAEGQYWRMYAFIENARSYDQITSPVRAEAAARAFGQFLRHLESFPASELHETIPDFHNTPARFAALLKAIGEDRHQRAATVRAEIDFFLRREGDAQRLVNLRKAGRLPLRVTHNDCKLNNVMLDDETGEGVCVIDLDTVMPGLSLYDFGDMVRTATSSAPEDCTDLEKVQMQMPMFSALLKGFLAGVGGALTAEEVEQLPFAGKLITLETGMRFLTDYLNGDVYFKIARPSHNLDRCRTQCRLVESIESQLPAMAREVATLVEAAGAMSGGHP